MTDATRYSFAEFAEGPVSDREQHPVLALTFEDVERVTGVTIKPGMVVEHRYDSNVFKVRVRSSPTGNLITDWTTVSQPQNTDSNTS